MERITNLSRQNPEKITVKDLEALKEERLADVRYWFNQKDIPFPITKEGIENLAKKKEAMELSSGKGDIADRQIKLLRRVGSLLPSANYSFDTDKFELLCGSDGDKRSLTMEDVKAFEARKK